MMPPVAMNRENLISDKRGEDTIENDITETSNLTNGNVKKPMGRSWKIDMKQKPFLDMKKAIIGEKEEEEEQHYKIDKRILINVGGEKFETFSRTLENIPGTRLALLSSLMEEDESYDAERNEYFFDRNPAAFRDILNFYRTEELHIDQSVCGNGLKSELDFWGVEEQDIEPCCWSSYSKFVDHKDTLAALDDDFATAPTSSAWGAEKPWHTRFRYNMWRLLEDPTSSIMAKVYVAVSMTFVMLSIALFVLETHCKFRIISYKAPNSTLTTVCECKDHNVLDVKGVCESKVNPVMEYIDYVCFVFFFVEIVLRFSFSMDRKAFLKTPLNIIDIICILPYLLSLILKNVGDNDDVSRILRAVLALRVIRLLRIFRLMKHYVAFKILVYTIKVSSKELILIVVLLFIGVLIFACLIHLVESDTFDNIPIGFWWALVTMTTVGYGDKYPKREAGYFVGSICVICGVLTIAFTVPIVVNNFTLYYSHAQSRTKLPLKSRKKWAKELANKFKLGAVKKAIKLKPPKSPEDNCDRSYVKPPNYVGKHKPEVLNDMDDVKINNTNNLDKLPIPDKNIVHIGGKLVTEDERAQSPSARHGRFGVSHGGNLRNRMIDVGDTQLEDVEGVNGDIRTVSTDSGYGATKAQHEEATRQLLTEMADADRQRMDERRRQAVIMAQKRDKKRQQRDDGKQDDGSTKDPGEEEM
ncbi:potassium voltage-gated channel protein Shaw-like isoform X2 [Lineus longissimus]|uniref:potassium voltage-gated channel protein Shaw-like isoform X2 n=1 Tax=Lineus longissimus TaxID=88925 RepID=UPI00315D4158